MSTHDDPLALDAPRACERIEHLLRSTLERLGRAGALVGLSGGLDSALAAVLCVRAVGADRMHLYYLPERDSNKRHRRDAALLARGLGVTLRSENITPVLGALGIYDLLPLKWIPGRRCRAWAVRLANRTELLTGTFSMWGCDHSADVMPLLHLYRTQVERLADFLGLPASIRGKTADPDVLPGIEDKGRLLGSFREADPILHALESGEPRERIEERCGAEAVRGIVALMDHSRHLREAPYTASAGET